MNRTWGQRRHFHKSFYGCHHLDRTWARAVFSFQSPPRRDLHSPPSHWGRSAHSDQTAGQPGVLQSLLAPTWGGCHPDHCLPSLIWNLEKLKFRLCLIFICSLSKLTFAYVAHPLLCKCKLSVRQFVDV